MPDEVLVQMLRDVASTLRNGTLEQASEALGALDYLISMVAKRIDV